MTLTGQWEKGELEEHKKYYCKTEWSEDIFQARCYNKDTKGEWRVLENEKYRYNNIYHTKDIEVLAPVPSCEEWQASENYIDHLKQCISVYESKEKQHTDDAIAYNELKEENQQLKELLHPLKCCLSSENIEPQIRVEKSLAKIEEFLTNGE